MNSAMYNGNKLNSSVFTANRRNLSILYSKENGSFGDLGCVYSPFANGDFLQRQEVDWDGFEGWLESKGLTKKHCRSMVSYGKRYGHILFSGKFNEIKKEGKNHVLMALANLSKFMGQYSYFQKLKTEAGLTWHDGGKGLDVFKKIYENELDGLEEWVDKVVEIGDKEFSVPVVFLGLSGLRVVEAVKSLNRIRDYGLDGYCKDGLLEHFRFPEDFLRGNKNAYVTVLPDRMIEILEGWKKSVNYNMMVNNCRRKYKLPIMFHGLRKFYATTLRMGGDSV